MAFTFPVLPVSFSAMLAMILASLVMVLTPGPNMMYLLSRSIGQGRRAGLISLAGTGLGFVLYMLMANLGLSIVFVNFPWLFVGFKAAGVVYLGYMAWQSLRPVGRNVMELQEVKRDTSARLFRMGLMTNFFNPKTAIMYLTLIPQFIDPNRGNYAFQGLFLGLCQISVSLIINAAIVVTSEGIASLLARKPRWGKWQR